MSQQRPLAMLLVLGVLVLACSRLAAGRDPALEAALAYEPPDSLLEQLKEKLRMGGMEAASSHYFNYRNSPATAAVNTEQALLGAADFLITENRPADAVRLLQAAVGEYRESAACQLALGKRLVEQGQGQEALGPLKKAEELVRTKK